MKLTRQPRTECKREMVADYQDYAVQLALSAASDGGGDKPQLEKKTGVLYLTLFVQGRLTNVETGRSVSYFHSKPYRHVNTAGDTDCPASSTGFEAAMREAAQGIADNLSPGITELSVPLLADAADIRSDSQRGLVGDYLSSGNQWAAANNFERAAKDWKRALNESDGESVSAMWNLAVYSWYAGDYDEAERYFESALDGAGPSWLDGPKRELMSRFEEQKRLAEGR